MGIRRSCRVTEGALLLAAFLVGVLPATAQRSGELPPVFDGVGLEEQLGRSLPMDLVFADAQGEAVRLGSYFDGEKPVLLMLVYHDCPMLCNLLLDGATRTLRDLAWTPGQEFEVVTVSFSPREGPDLASRQKARYVEILGRPAAAQGWHFLTGSEASIAALAEAVGFQFQWVEERQEYAHPAALMFASGAGKLTRYLYGLEFSARDVRTALVEASEGTVGTTVDKILLYCFQYDPQENSYVPHAINIMKLGGLLTLLLLGLFLAVLWRRERHRPDPATLSS
jgi:protein SCO1/2